MADPKRSINSFSQRLETRAGEIGEILSTIPQGSRPSSRIVARIEELEKTFKAQWQRLEDKYDTILEAAEIDTKDEDEVKAIYEKAKVTFNKSKTDVERVLDAHDQVQVSPTQGSNQGSTLRSMKIEKVLKPKEPLNESMTLEEVEHWLKGYEAFMDHNKEVLTQEGIKVSRAILDGCLDPKLSTRLRNAQDDNGENKVKDETSILDCLKVLKEMFLEATPLWLRRLNYFKCSQN